RRADRRRAPHRRGRRQLPGQRQRGDARRARLPALRGGASDDRGRLAAPPVARRLVPALTALAVPRARRAETWEHRRMGSPDRNVVFVHGLWLHADSWTPWVERFGAAGYSPNA